LSVFVRFRAPLVGQQAFLIGVLLCTKINGNRLLWMRELLIQQKA
jgi:hypothetical protein